MTASVVVTAAVVAVVVVRVTVPVAVVVVAVTVAVVVVARGHPDDDVLELLAPLGRPHPVPCLLYTSPSPRD